MMSRAYSTMLPDKLILYAVVTAISGGRELAPPYWQDSERLFLSNSPPNYATCFAFSTADRRAGYSYANSSPQTNAESS